VSICTTAIRISPSCPYLPVNYELVERKRMYPKDVTDKRQKCLFLRFRVLAVMTEEYCLWICRCIVWQKFADASKKSTAACSRDGGNTYLRHVSKLVPDYTASHPRR
jgi:hypothetical protein